MRRQVVLDTLREHPWSSSSMLAELILEETGGRPTIATGALWIAPWTLYTDLRVLEDDGKVERRQFSKRTILWRAT